MFKCSDQIICCTAMSIVEISLTTSHPNTEEFFSKGGAKKIIIGGRMLK